MATLRYNHTAILHIELGQTSIIQEELDLRNKITRPTMPDNTVMLAYPYPKNYKVDRWERLACIVNADLSVEYLLVFVHSCLLWKHARQYVITQGEYEKLLVKMTNKHADRAAHVYTGSDFVSTDYDFNLFSLSTIGE